MIAASSLGFRGTAAPPPLRVTLRAGQPKLRSTWSTRPSPTSIRTAWPTVAGSLPYSCTERGDSSASKVTMRAVRALPWSRASASTISLTYRPAP